MTYQVVEAGSEYLWKVKQNQPQVWQQMADFLAAPMRAGSVHQLFGDRQRVARVSRVPRLLDSKAGLAHEPCDPLMVDRFALSP